MSRYPLDFERVKYLRACKGMPVGIFYSQHYKGALEVCGRCPVRKACLSACIDEERRLEAYHVKGVRGGLTEQERRHLYARMERGAA